MFSGWGARRDSWGTQDYDFLHLIGFARSEMLGLPLIPMLLRTIEARTVQNPLVFLLSFDDLLVGFGVTWNYSRRTPHFIYLMFETIQPLRQLGVTI